MYKIKEIKNLKEIKELEETSCFTWEGMSTEEENLKVIEEAIRNEGFDKETVEFITITGEQMNRYCKLKKDLYPADLTILCIPEFYNPMFKIRSGARWMNDIVANNKGR